MRKENKGFIKMLFAVVLVGLFLAGALVLGPIYFGGETNKVSEVTSRSVVKKEVINDFSVEKLTVDKSLSNAWVLNGMIRNNKSRPVKGYVKIKFLNARRDIVHVGKAFVNSLDFFSSGVAASFNYAVPPNNFDGVVDYEVMFVEK